MKEDKILYFEYILSKLIIWYKEIFPTVSHPELKFSKLKVLKLLFFVTTINSSKRKRGLLDIFNKFYAMSYGPVESDIYNAILKDTTTIFNIGDQYTTIKNGQNFERLNPNIKKEIDNSIENLKKTNKNLICFDSYKLVDISHKWNSWINSMNIALALGKRSELMNVEDILNDTKYYDE